MVAQQNQTRVHTNGHHRSANGSQATDSVIESKPTIKAGDVEKLMRDNPGAVLIAGLVTGGVVGWLTLKLSR